MPASARKRGLLVTEEVDVQIRGVAPEQWLSAEGRGMAASVMRGFILGGRCKVSRRRGRSVANMRQIENAEELWEMCFRYGGALSGSRLLGRFKDTDLFIGLKLVPKLGFENHFQSAVTVWTERLPSCSPVSAPDLSAYLSEAEHVGESL
jgi:hypothetical protein